MSDREYSIADLGDHRVLTVDGRDHPTHYSTRVLQMLVDRKGPARAVRYLSFRRERAPLYLGPLFAWLHARGARDLAVLEVGCAFGHMTEYLADRPEVATIDTFDTDREFVEIVRAKRDELALGKVREIKLLSNDETRRLPWRDGAFDLVLAVGVVEHLPRERRAHVDEYYRVLAPGGHIAILDTPNRWFPYETHSIGLPLVQWLPSRVAYRYARLLRPAFRDVPYEEFVADGTGWRNATLKECLPSAGRRGLTDVTEDAGYGSRFFPATAGHRMRKLRPLLDAVGAAARVVGRPPWVCLPYLNLVFRKAPSA
jgi:SAM-dependent methyltransferase